ncbi:MAG: GyrI-like domain-containing protein [Treponema sp.]|nr:GyrI-like domain-containing protein [Treponema sp.]
MIFDFKKYDKDFYDPKTSPSIVDVPKMTFIVIDGKGDPNSSAEYASAIEALYGISYTIKMSNKDVLEYVVPPLEGFWSVDDKSFKGGGAPIADKGKFIWSMIIRQPDFVETSVFDAARRALAKKKPGLDTSRARLDTFAEGLCAQALHLGPYDDEGATIAALEKFALEKGYEIDINETRRHHEIYLSDPRKTAPEKLKTIIRHPIKAILSKPLLPS